MRRRMSRAVGDMANRLLAEHIEMAGVEEAGVAAGSEIMTVQALRIEEICEVVRRRIGRAAGVSAVSVSGDLDQVRVDIEAARPGVVHGHGGAEAHRLCAELEGLTGKPVLLKMLREPGPQEGEGDAGSGGAGGLQLIRNLSIYGMASPQWTTSSTKWTCSVYRIFLGRGGYRKSFAA